MGFSACNDYMQTTKQSVSWREQVENGGNHEIIEDKYATLGGSFIDISLTSQWAIAGIYAMQLRNFAKK